MFTIRVKDTSPDLEIFVSRAMLMLAAFAAVFYPVSNYYICIFCSMVLFFASLFVKKIFRVFKINQFFLSLFAAVLLFIATHSFWFAVFFIVFGKMVKYVYHSPEISIGNSGVTVKKTLSNKQYKWTKFNNVVLKDNLLTLDFVNNKIIQVYLDNEGNDVDENAFNVFCSDQLKSIG